MNASQAVCLALCKQLLSITIPRHMAESEFQLTPPVRNQNSGQRCLADNGGQTNSSIDTRTGPHMAFIKFGVRELCKWHFWASCLGECLATCLFVFLTTGTTITWNTLSPPSTEMIALSFGLSIATLAMATSHLSGGHINPAVSIAMLVSGRISVFRGLFFVIFQLGGGIGGSAMLYGLTPSEKRATLGATEPAAGVTRYQALGIEAVLTFLLVFTVFASTDPKRHHYGYEVPLSIGFCVSVCHFIGIGFTGCGINPARSLGPAVIMNIWTDHWVYWAGPIGGGLIAALVYQLIFRAREHQGPEGSSEQYVLENYETSKF